MGDDELKSANVMFKSISRPGINRESTTSLEASACSQSFTIEEGLISEHQKSGCPTLSCEVNRDIKTTLTQNLRKNKIFLPLIIYLKIQIINSNTFMRLIKINKLKNSVGATQLYNCHGPYRRLQDSKL